MTLGHDPSIAVKKGISLFRDLNRCHPVHSCSNFLFRYDMKCNKFYDRCVHCLSIKSSICHARSITLQQLLILFISSVRIHVSSLRMMSPVFCNSVSGNFGLNLKYQSWKLLAKDLNDLKHYFYARLWMSGYNASHRDWNVGMLRVFESMSWLGIERVGPIWELIKCLLMWMSMEEREK